MECEDGSACSCCSSCSSCSFSFCVLGVVLLLVIAARVLFTLLVLLVIVLFLVVCFLRFALLVARLFVFLFLLLLVFPVCPSSCYHDYSAYACSCYYVSFPLLFCSCFFCLFLFLSLSSYCFSFFSSSAASSSSSPFSCFSFLKRDAICQVPCEFEELLSRVDRRLVSATIHRQLCWSPFQNVFERKLHRNTLNIIGR